MLYLRNEGTSSARALDLASYFNTVVLKHDDIDNEQFESALETLWQVSRLDIELRRAGKYFPYAVSKERSFGVKVFQSITVGNKNKDVHENKGKANVEIDWDQTPEEMYLHLIKQPDSSVYNDFTPFQKKYLEEVEKAEMEEALQRYKTSKLVLLENFRASKRY